MPAVAIAPSRHRTGLVWILALSVVGYPLAGLIGAASGVSSTLTSIPFRLAVIAMALVIVANAALLRTRFRPDYLLLSFWAVYIFRLSWDFAIAGVPDADTALAFFIATVALPCVAVMVVAHDFDERAAAWAMFVVGAAVSTLSVLMYLLGYGASSSLTEETGRLSFAAVNPITLGHAAVTTMLAALAAWRTAGSTRRIVLLIGCGAAVACCVLAASRGPLLALGAALFLYAIIRRKWGWILVTVALVAYLLPGLIADNSVELLARFSNLDQDESSLARLITQANAIQAFVENPVFGSAYTETLTNEYPHNLIIESGMALGVGGLVLFIAICLRGSWQAWKGLRGSSTLAPMLFVQYLIGAQLSGSLYGASGFWLAATLLTAVPIRLAIAAKRSAQRPLQVLPA